jgi:hypothetical protein
MGVQSSWADKNEKEPTDGVAIPRMKNMFTVRLSQWNFIRGIATPSVGIFSGFN